MFGPTEDANCFLIFKIQYFCNFNSWLKWCKVKEDILYWKSAFFSNGEVKYYWSIFFFQILNPPTCLNKCLRNISWDNPFSMHHILWISKLRFLKGKCIAFALFIMSPHHHHIYCISIISVWSQTPHLSYYVSVIPECSLKHPSSLASLRVTF